MRWFYGHCVGGSLHQILAARQAVVVVHPFLLSICFCVHFIASNLFFKTLCKSTMKVAILLPRSSLQSPASNLTFSEICTLKLNFIVCLLPRPRARLVQIWQLLSSSVGVGVTRLVHYSQHRTEPKTT